VGAKFRIAAQIHSKTQISIT